MILMLVAQVGAKMISPTLKVSQALNSLTLLVGYNQIIDKPTHVINNFMWYIDLTFCTNQSVISNHGNDVSIFHKCHHSIIYGKINIHVPLPPTYVWGLGLKYWKHYESFNSNFNWNKVFENLLVDEKVKFLNKTLLNIFRNYIPNKKIKCNYWQPPWMTDNIRSIPKEDIRWKSMVIEQLFMIKFWKSLTNARSKFLKLKKTTFLIWPKRLQILMLFQKCTELK